jgi:hypothetical protein
MEETFHYEQEAAEGVTVAVYQLVLRMEVLKATAETYICQQEILLAVQREQ